jgi:hypothetical protein
MNANLSKPKRHTLPRLWIQVADTLRLARRFTIRLPVSAEEVVTLIQATEDIKFEKEPWLIVKTHINRDKKPITFGIILTQVYKEQRQGYIAGIIREEENLRITTIQGAAYPSANDLFLILCMGTVGILSAYGVTLELCRGILGLLLFLIISAVIGVWIFIVGGRDRFLETFTKHLQVTEAEGTIHEC